MISLLTSFQIYLHLYTHTWNSIIGMTSLRSMTFIYKIVSSDASNWTDIKSLNELPIHYINGNFDYFLYNYVWDAVIYLLYCVVRLLWWHIQETFLCLTKFAGFFVKFLFVFFYTTNAIFSEIFQRNHNLIMSLCQLKMEQFWE